MGVARLAVSLLTQLSTHNRRHWASSYGWDLCILGIWSLVLFTLGLGGLEFFRHTEADRTLIAWEMVQSGNWLVPHLIGSPILTKPPLYYWYVASLISFFGNSSEFVVRLSSAFAAVLLVLVQYIAVRKAFDNRNLAFVSSIMLSTSVQFMLLASVAEIDMTFGLLSASACWLGYFVATASRLTFIRCFLAGLVVGLAFLAKGPPVIVFYAVAQLGFLFVERIFPIVTTQHLPNAADDTRCNPSRCEDGNNDLQATSLASTVKNFLLLHSITAGACLLVTMLWLVPLVRAVGFDELKYHFSVEIFERVVVESFRNRGHLFYLGSFLEGLLPWSLMLLPVFLALARRDGRRSFVNYCIEHKWQRPVLYTAAVFLLGLLLISMAQGKSSRYGFPLLPFAVQLLTVSILWFTKYVASQPEYWPRVRGLEKLIPVFATRALSGLKRVLSDTDLQIRYFAALTALMFLVKCGYALVFTPLRNHSQSVIPVAKAVEEILPKGETLYQIEMFQRWATYYLKRSGINTKRVSPEIAAAHLTTPELMVKPIYILIDAQEEAWRLDELRQQNITPEILLTKTAARDTYTLLRIPGSALQALHPRRRIPTYPSPPFYHEKHLIPDE